MLIFFLRFSYFWQWLRCDGGYSKVRELGIGSSQTTIIKLNNIVKAVLVNSLVKHPIPSQGGAGKIVQIDESLFVRRKVQYSYCTIVNVNHGAT